MLVNVATTCSATLGRAMTPLEFVNAVRNVTGKKFAINIDPSATVQDLCDACDAQMIIDPTKTTNEVIIENGVVLDKSATLAAAGVSDGDSVTYKFYLKVD